jgi:hypothetical protein
MHIHAIMTGAREPPYFPLQYIYLYRNTYTYICIYTNIHTYILICTYSCNNYRYSRALLQILLPLSVYKYIFIYINIYMYIHVYIYIYIYILISIYSSIYTITGAREPSYKFRPPCFPLQLNTQRNHE